MPYTAGTAWESEDRSITAYLTILSGSQPYAEDDFNTISAIGIESELVSTKNLSFGNTCSTKATISLKKVKADFKSYLTKGTGVLLELECSASGATLGHNEYLLYIDEIESMESRETYTESGTTHYYNDITLVCYDAFYKTEIPYVPTITISAESPKNLLVVAKDVMKVAGFTSTETKNYAQGFSTDLTIDSIPENVSCREMLGYLAGYQGGNCIFKTEYVDNEPFTYVSPVIVEDSTAKTITQDEQYMGAYIIGGNLVELNRVESGTADSIAVYPSNGEIGNSISYENPYIQNDTAGLARVQAIQEAVIAKARAIQDPSADSLDYTPMEVQWRGNPQILVGEMVKVEDKYGNTQYCLIMGKSISFDGGLSETYRCYGETEKSVSFTINPVMKQIERRLTAMEEAILEATEQIGDVEAMQAGVFDIIPNSQGTANIGWKIASNVNGHYILANINGIGFSSNGGQSFNAAAIYFDSNGNGHINGNFITANSITTEMLTFDPITSTNLQSAVNGITIQGSTISSITTIPGYSDLMTTVNSKATTAEAEAAGASAGTTAAEEQIASFSREHNLTYIDSNGIYTGTITAQQINVGWGGANYASLGYASGDTSYLSWTTDSANEYKTKVSVITSIPSGTEKSIYGKPFYAMHGAVIAAQGIANPRIGAYSSYRYCGIAIEYSSTPNGTYTQKAYVSTAGTDVYSGYELNTKFTATAAGYFRLKVYFRYLDNNADITKITITQSVSGEMIVNGVIRSNNKKTYFDLNSAELWTMSSASPTSGSYATLLDSGGITQKVYENGEYKDFGYFYPTISSSSYVTMAYHNARSSGISLGYDDDSNYYRIVEIKQGAATTGGQLTAVSDRFCSLVNRRDTAYGTYYSKCGIGTDNVGGRESVAVALENSSNNTIARLDVARNDGNGGVILQGQSSVTGGQGVSQYLVLGTSHIWWGTQQLDTGSKEEYKKDISLYTGDAVKTIAKTPFFTYRNKEESEDKCLRYGVIIERDCPKEILQGDGSAISTYSMATLAWRAIQQLNNRIKELEEKYERKS